MKRTLLVLPLLPLFLAACPKSPPSPDDAAAKPAATTSSTTGAILDSKPAAEGGAGAAGAAPAGAAAKYTGKYAVVAGTMYVPAEKDWASVKFKNDETRLLGDGDITLAVDPSGRVSGGTEAGPLGASILDGTSEGGVLTATIRRKDPADEGLTGTLVAKIAEGGLEGSMKLAEFNAAVVRTATVTAKKN